MSCNATSQSTVKSGIIIREVLISFGPIIGTKQSADHRSILINGFSPIRRMVTPTILRQKLVTNIRKMESADLA